MGICLSQLSETIGFYETINQTSYQAACSRQRKLTPNCHFVFRLNPLEIPAGERLPLYAPFPHRIRHKQTTM